MGDNKRKPDIRFQGFTDDWEQRKLSEVADKVTEKNSNFIVQETFTNSAEFGVISQRDFFDHDISNAENIGGYYVVRDEDFVYNPRISVTAPVGPVNRNKLGRSGVMSPLYTVFRTHDIDTTYLEWFFKSSYWHPFMFFNGDSGARSDRFSIKDAVFFEMPIPLPSTDEQKEIGAYLDKIDNLITLQQRKCDKLVNVKKSMLEKMFPREGAKVPEIRFEGFTDDWEQRKLGEICQVTMGQSPDGSTYSETPSDYILVQGNADLKEGWVSPRIWTTQKTKTADVGDLIMSVRAPAGSMGKTSYNVVLGRGVAGIKGNEFIYQSLVKMDSDGYWKKLAAGSTFESINSDVVNGADLMVPQDIDEQNKIGDYFSSIDTLITLQQCKS
ncbi:MAG: restriction endonuclease subunit S [Agathobacter sp.]|nr:restriction endonuclease subunit S [Agathobacter sp.]